jgi:hypothetical protein
LPQEPEPGFTAPVAMVSRTTRAPYTVWFYVFLVLLCMITMREVELLVVRWPHQMACATRFYRGCWVLCLITMRQAG